MILPNNQNQISNIGTTLKEKDKKINKHNPIIKCEFSKKLSMLHSSHFLCLFSSFSLPKSIVNLNKAANIHHQNFFLIIDPKQFQNLMGHAIHSFHTQYLLKKSYKIHTIFGLAKWERTLTVFHMKLGISLKDMLLLTVNAHILSLQKVKLFFMTGIKSLNHSEKLPFRNVLFLT